MASRQYRFRFYLNARHAVTIENTESRIHPHTWEMVLYITKMNEDVFLFTQIDNALKAFFSGFEGRLLNDTGAFRNINPTMENIGEVFYGRLKEVLLKQGWALEVFEISENPGRTYIISGEPLAEHAQPAEQVQPEEPEAEIVTPEAAGPDSEQRDAVQPEPADCEPKPAEVSSEDVEDIVPVEEATVEAGHSSAKADRFVYLCAGTASAAAVALLTLLWINRGGGFPWGSDGWGHIFKAELLYRSLLKGEFLPLYTGLWYNGIQPFRYWAPLPYYILSSLMLVSGGNISLAYNLFIAFLLVTGNTGWLLWGLRTGSRKTAFVLGLLWFFMPDNLRVLFSEGNYPRSVAAALFPFVLLGIRGYLDKRNRKDAFLIGAGMLLITLTHAMAAAMAAVSLTFYVLAAGLLEKRLKSAVQATFLLLSGIMSAGIWLFPALKGGMLSLDTQAVADAMKQFTHSAASSLEPLLRLGQTREAYYFGLSVLIIALLGAVFSGNKGKSAFITVLVIFIGTTRLLLPLYDKLPLGQLLWMERFTPFALGIFFAGLLAWKKLRKRIRQFLILLVAADCLLSFYLLGYNVAEPGLKKDLDVAANITASRVALLDLGTYGSYPAYYLSSGEKGKSVGQVFGWASQGASTINDIVRINTALEKGWYSYLLDRCKELGADTLIVRRDKLPDEDAFINTAGNAGYSVVYRSDLNLILKLPEVSAFGTIPRYKGLAIGKFAVNLSYIFPEIKMGSSIYLDDYSEDELSGYSFLYLSGFSFRDKAKAEWLVTRLSEKGIKIMLELSEDNSELLTSRPGFLGISAQPVTFEGKLPPLELSGNEKVFNSPFPVENHEWRTSYLENLDHVYGIAYFHNQELAFLGTKINPNIIFAGFNLPFYALETKDPEALHLLEGLTGMKAGQVPHREIVPVTVEQKGNILHLLAAKPGTVTGLAALDAFRPLAGSAGREDELIKMQGTGLEVEIVYPYIGEGAVLTLLGLLLFAAAAFRGGKP